MQQNSVGTERVDHDENASDEESDIEYDHNAIDDTNYPYPISAKYGQKWYPTTIFSPGVISVLQNKLKSIEGFIPNITNILSNNPAIGPTSVYSKSLDGIQDMPVAEIPRGPSQVRLFS